MDHRSFSVPCLRTLIMRQNAVVKLVSRSVVLLLTNNNSNTWGSDLLIYGVLTRIKFIQTKTKKIKDSDNLWAYCIIFYDR